MNKKISLLLSALIIAFGVNAFASNWTTYTNSNSVRQIIYSGDNIWGATSGGLISINRATGGMSKLTNTEGLKGIDFNCVEKDTIGGLWFGESDGWLTNISGSGVIRNYPFRDSIGLSGRPVALFDLQTDGDRLWVASDLGISKFLPFSHGGEIKDTARKLGQLPDQEDVVCLAIIGNNLWAGTARGIAFINKDNTNIQYFGYWRSFAVGDNGLINQDIRSVISYYDTVLVGTAGGVYKFITSPDTSWQPMGLSGETVNKLFMWNSRLLAAAGSGLYEYSPSGWQIFQSSGLPQGIANDFTADSDDSLWAATPGSGMAKLSNDSWALYSVPGPATNFINHIAIDSSGLVWMTHQFSGMSMLSDDQWTIVNAANSDPDGPGPLQGLQDDWAYDVMTSRDGILWVGSWGNGIYRHLNNSWDHWNAGNSPMYGVPINHAYWAASAIADDPAGNIWATSLEADSGLIMGVFDKISRWQLFLMRDSGLPNNTVFDILAERNYVWVGRVDGLDRLDFGNDPFNMSDDHWNVNFSPHGVNELAIDPFGFIWFASSDGVYFIDPAIDTAAAIAVPLEISGTVNTVASDGIGNIWIGTTGGAGMLRPNRTAPELSTWAALYNTGNSPLVNNKVNNIAVQSSTGKVFIGTQAGLSIYESGILPPNENLSGMEAYPNPAVPGNGGITLSFQRVPADGVMTIYTVSGEIVARFDLSRQRTWDLRNSKGEIVAGGIYIFNVNSGKTSGTGKFAVIR